MAKSLIQPIWLVKKSKFVWRKNTPSTKVFRHFFQSRNNYQNEKIDKILRHLRGKNWGQSLIIVYFISRIVQNVTYTIK